MAELSGWLLFLGAGASIPPPTQLPAFAGLVGEVLEAIGWRWEPEEKLWRRRTWPLYPPIERVGETAEVLFGRLNEMGVPFAEPLSARMSGVAFNAVHEVAAAVLADGGCVWTTNLDAAVEAACAQRGFRPPRAGRTGDGRGDPDGLEPLSRAASGSLVKFHGSVEHPEGLALADLQLLTPLPAVDHAHLVQVAHGRTVVLHGYQGADADLADVLQEVLEGARSVTWFEPRASVQAGIRRTFPTVADRIAFVPPFSRADVEDGVVDVLGTSTGFLRFVQTAGHRVPSDLAALMLGERLDVDGQPAISELPVSGATQARLVQHFGVRTGAETADAWSQARREDAAGLRWRAVPLHVRRLLGESIYADGGWVGTALRWAGHHPAVVAAVRPRRVGRAMSARAMALLLDDGDLDGLRALLDAGVPSSAGSEPVLSYYRAHVARYRFRPDEVWAEATASIEGMEDARDPQRLASALFEAGCAAVYRADFDGALRLAFELQERRGRYALPRWRAWGAWLEVMALAHQGELDRTGEPLERMRQRFEPERSAKNAADVRTVELLLARLRMAHGVPLDPAILVGDGDADRQGRYRDDLDLALADIAIAVGDRDEAMSRLTRVAASSVPVSRHCARRGLAELDRLADVPEAADSFAALAAEAGNVGAVWYQAQAVLGLELCGDGRSAAGWEAVEQAWPARTGSAPERARAALGHGPRPLWLVTI